MDFHERFETLADGLESHPDVGGPDHLGRAATQVLVDNRALLSIPPAACLQWLLTSRELPPQTWDNDFGQPSVTVACRPSFRIDLLYWRQKAAAIHKHVSCGAFAAISGERIHGRYRFESERAFDSSVEMGRLDRLASEVMRPGDVREIQPHHIHDLYWINTPSLTLTVRCVGHPGHEEAAWEYHQPGLGVLDAMHQPDSLVSKRVEGLRLLAQAAPGLYRQAVQDLLERGAPLLAYHAFRDALLLLSEGEEAESLLTRIERADGLLAILAEISPGLRRRMLMESVYCGKDREAQLLAGILWAEPEGLGLRVLLQQAFPEYDVGDALNVFGDRLSSIAPQAYPYVAAAKRSVDQRSVVR